MSDSVAYLVMDLINDIAHEKGPFAASPLGQEIQRRDVIATTRRMIDAARKAKIRVGFVRLGFSPDYRECPPSSPIFSPARDKGLFKLGTWGTEVHPYLGATDEDIDVVKHRVSPFFGTNLEVTLRSLGINTLYISGVSTNNVIQSAVREGHDRDFRCILIEDCCAANSEEEHQAVVAHLSRHATSITSDDTDFH